MVFRRLLLLIISGCLLTSLIAQPITKTDALKIYNATELLNVGKKKGIHEIENIVSPIDLVYLNPQYGSAIIDIEFKTGFLKKHHSEKNIYTYGIPTNTMEVADMYGDIKAGAKLFEYYCKLPKYIKSDTIRSIYNNLDDFLKLLVKYKSPKLIERLKKDYYEWSNHAKKAPKKSYQSVEEMMNTTFEESMKFKPSDLYVDCNFMALQIAGALNSLQVIGFDDKLLEKLKKEQSWPFAKSYSFPKTFNNNSTLSVNSAKSFENVTAIKSFRNDIKKLYELLVQNEYISSDSDIYRVIEDGSKACVYVTWADGYGVFRVELTEKNKVRVVLISSTTE